VGGDVQRGLEGDAKGQTGGKTSGGASSGSGGARGEGAAVFGGPEGEEARGGMSSVSCGGGGGCEWGGEEGWGPIQGEGRVGGVVSCIDFCSEFFMLQDDTNELCS
jgi:hypothetical protein